MILTTRLAMTPHRPNIGHLVWLCAWILMTACGEECPHPKVSVASDCKMIPCINGVCKPQTIPTSFGPFLVETCECAYGWAGPACDTCCNITCDHGECTTDALSNIYCECEDGYTSENCSIPVVLTTTPAQNMAAVNTVTQQDVNCSSNVSTSAPVPCGEYQCFNGNCKNFLPGIHFCQCSLGWDGPSCDICCDLPCVNGICYTNPGTREQYCSCEGGHGGSLCEEPPTKSPRTTGTSQQECSAVPRNNIVRCMGIPCYNGQCQTGSMNRSGIITETFSCVCDQGWTGHRCESCCDRFCGNGICEVEFDTKEMFCNCEANYTGPNCSEPIVLETPKLDREFPGWSWAIIAAVILVMLLLTSMMIHVFRLLRTQPTKLPRWILKMLHHLSREAEDKEFDAFVSYRSSREDQNFVVQQLMTKLEGEMGFKICFHARNFIPGNTIADNILDAVTKSRRTILVISPSYLQAEWPRYEYQVALQEMLKQKHRVIPVILKSISSETNIDPVLQQMLATITYIEWPGHEDRNKEAKFWEDLKLSMPRARTSTATNMSHISNTVL